MFSTPQSKAYFNQEVIKGKLLTQQINLVSYMQQELREVNSNLIKLVISIETVQSQHLFDLLKTVKTNLNSIQQAIFFSNQAFHLQVSLRDQIKHLEHTFFKKVMKIYEEKIKSLKQSLLEIEDQVQQMQRKGLLPYVEQPHENNILTIKNKCFDVYKQKISLEGNLEKLQISKQCERILVQKIRMALQRLKRVEEINYCQEEEKQNPLPLKQSARQNKTKTARKPKHESSQDHKNQHEQKQKNKNGQNLSKEKQKQRVNCRKYLFEEMTGIQLCLQKLKNIKIKGLRKQIKFKIEATNQYNKKIKDGIHQIKKIMDYQQKQRMVRNRNCDMVREEAIDFMRDMADNLKRRLQNRNLYMIVVEMEGSQFKKSKSQIIILNHQQDSEDDCQDNQDNEKQDENKLVDSFLDQCSYLVSDRFDVNQDETDQTVAVCDV